MNTRGLSPGAAAGDFASFATGVGGVGVAAGGAGASLAASRPVGPDFAAGGEDSPVPQATATSPTVIQPPRARLGPGAFVTVCLALGATECARSRCHGAGRART